MSQRKMDDLGTQSVGKLLMRLALPAIAAQLVNVLYNMVDRMYIGHIPDIGANALTGMGVTLPLIMIISAFAALVSMGGAPKAAIFMGQQNKPAAEKTMGNCFSLQIVVSIVLTAVFLLFGKQLLVAFGASENTLPYAWDYLRIYAIGTVFVQLSLGMNAFITTQGFATTSMLTVVIGALINIILDPIFIFVFNMGVQGAAIATVIAQGVSATWVVIFLRGKKTNLRLKKENFRLKKQVILPCLALGFAPFVMQSTEGILVICFNSSLLRYGGDLAVGAMTILTSVRQFAMLPIHGLTQGGQPIISYNYGAKNGKRVKSTFRLLLIACVGYSTLMWGLTMLFPQVFAGIFTNDAQLIAYASWGMRIYMATALVFGAQIACQQTFVALGNAKISIFLAVLRKIILLIPLIYILPLFFADKVMAVFLAEPIADIIAATTTLTLFIIQFKKTMAQMES